MDTNEEITRWRRIAWGLVPVAASFVAWAHLLDSHFHADDFVHLYFYTNSGLAAFVFQTFAGHLCLLRNLVMAAGYEAFGAEPRGYFAMAILLQASSAGLLAAVLRRLGTGPRLAALVATAWAVLPGHEGTLGWMSVHGQALGTAATLIWILLSTDEVGRKAAARGMESLPPRRACVVALVGIAAGNSFGTAFACALVLPLVVGLLRPGSLLRPATALALWACPAVLATQFVVMHVLPSPWTGRAVADAGTLVGIFLAPEGRSVWSAARPVAVLTASMLAAAAVELVEGAYFSRQAFLRAVDLLVAGGALALVAGGFAFGPARARRAIGATALLAVAAYGMIALGRAAPFAAFNVDLRLAATIERYHHLGSAMVALALATAWVALGERLPARVLQSGHRSRIGALVGPDLVALVALAGLVVLRTTHPVWVDDHSRDHAIFSNMQAETSAAAWNAPPGSVVCLDQRPFGVLPLPFRHVEQDFPGWAGALLAWTRDGRVLGRDVVFTSDDPVLGEAARLAGERGWRLAGVLSPVADCPPVCSSDASGQACR